VPDAGPPPRRRDHPAGPGQRHPDPQGRLRRSRPRAWHPRTTGRATPCLPERAGAGDHRDRAAVRDQPRRGDPHRDHVQPAGRGFRPLQLSQRPRLHGGPGTGDLLRGRGGGRQPVRRHTQRTRRPEGEVLMAVKGTGFLSAIWRTKGLARYMFWAGVLITAVFVFCGLFAPWVAPYGFDQTSANGVDFPKLAPPSSLHWLGTNDQFYDILIRMIWGARTALEVVAASVIMSAVIGVPLGLVSGFIG